MAVQWTITIEGKNDFGGIGRKEVRIDKSWERLYDGDVGLSIEDGKKIMAVLQSAAVSHEVETYTLFRRVCPDCHAFPAGEGLYDAPHPNCLWRGVGAQSALDAVRRLPSRHGSCFRATEGNLPGSSDARADGTNRAAGKHDAVPARRRLCLLNSCRLSLLKRMRPFPSVPSGSVNGWTSSADKTAIRDRALLALQQEGYCGFGDVTVISDGAEILKRLPRPMPEPTTHIIDWFHIVMKIQPMLQIAGHMARADGGGLLPTIDRDIRAVKWRLWHGRVDRAIRGLEQLLERVAAPQGYGEFSIARLRSLGLQLLTYIRSNRGAIVNYGKRYRAGSRVATILAESAVNSLVGKRMIKKQQMRWSLRGAHMLMQVRTAEINGDLHDRLRAPFRQPDPSVPPLFKAKPPLLRAA